MIPVEPAPEPADFDSKVRQPGLSAIAELVGEPLTIKRRGPAGGRSLTVGRRFHLKTFRLSGGRPSAI
jgi:hypothetical protein